MSALEARRRRAREAFWDVSGGLMSGARDGVEATVEAAIRVQITEEIASALGVELTPEQAGLLRAAFEAAGFEVET